MNNKVQIIEPTKRIHKDKQKLRVAAYCRVSTASIEQEDSFDNQVRFYKDRINANPNWELVDVFADQAISGTTKNRPEFQRMIEAARDGKIDLIITKSISRFSRNIADLTHYVQLLKEINVDIHFEEDRIQLLDDKSGLLLSILGAIAQMEVENTSSHVKWTLQHKMAAGEIVGNHAALGYDYVNDNGVKRLVINPEEAEIVKYIFSSYLDGDSLATIAKHLMNRGIKTKLGHTRWMSSTISTILKNDIYTGTLIQGKNYIESPLTHKRVRNDGQVAKYIVENDHEAIISQLDFDKVKEVMLSRTTYKPDGKASGSKRNNTQYAFSGKLICSYCGTKFNRRLAHPGTSYAQAYWVCAEKQVQKRCEVSARLREDYVKEAFVNVLNELLTTKNVFTLTDAEFEQIMSSRGVSDYEAEKQLLEATLKKVEQQKSKLLNLLIDEVITKEDYQDKILSLNTEFETVAAKITKVENLISSSNREAKDVSELRKMIEQNDVNAFNDELFKKLVNRVIVGGEIEKDGEMVDEPKKLTFVLNYEHLTNHFDDDALSTFHTFNPCCFYQM